MSGSLGRFPQTRWTLVQAAGEGDLPAGRGALAELLVRYLPALRAHLVLKRRLARDQADDLLQDFIQRRVLEAELIAKADRQRGKFRTFLLTSLDHFVSNAQRARRVRCRGAGRLLSLDSTAAPDPPDDGDLPDQAFDRQWARQVISQAIERMRAECERSLRRDLWEVFEARVLGPAVGDGERASYEQIVQRFDLRSPAQAANLLVTAKRMFARALRGVVAEYAEDGQIDEEILELKAILQARARPSHAQRAIGAGSARKRGNE